MNIITDVIVAFNTELQERKMRNLAVLETIVKTVLLCGQQNLALRGHRDDSQYTNDKNINTGNFSALLLEFRNSFQKHYYFGVQLTN